MTTQNEFLARRERLAGQLPPNSIALIPAAQEQIRNGDAHYRFRQNSNFYYLTGFNEPNATLVITKDTQVQSILFNQSRNPAAEQWTGTRIGQEGAIELLDMDDAFPIEQFSEALPRLLSNKDALYYVFGQDEALEQRIKSSLNHLNAEARKGLKAPQSLHDLGPILSDMRLFKSKTEIELLRKAAQISVDAHKRAMQQCKNSRFEHELEAELLYELHRNGCRNVAYDSIVAGGANACILHYTENNQPLKPGDLVLIDAGGEYDNYAADITRTFPVSGTFSKEQTCIYELVLKAQKAGIAAIKPGVAWNAIQQIIVHILTEGLCALGLLQGAVPDLIEQEAYKPFYMHSSGHWLGLDVHDAGRYKMNGSWRPLEAGMVLTVEPGLYISADMQAVDACWRGIGIRIEDDILVTPTGHEVLTGALPVDIRDIEALMRG